MASKKKKHRPKTIFVKEEAPLLGRTGGYVKDPDYALGADSRYATIPAHNRPPQLDQEYLQDKEAEHPPEPAAVYKDDLKRFTKEARELDSLRADFEHDRRLTEKQSLERRLTELISIARERGVDVHADIQFIKRRLDRIETKVKAA